jgi:hypothetical protein
MKMIWKTVFQLQRRQSGLFIKPGILSLWQEAMLMVTCTSQTLALKEIG